MGAPRTKHVGAATVYNVLHAAVTVLARPPGSRYPQVRDARSAPFCARQRVHSVGVPPGIVCVENVYPRDTRHSAGSRERSFDALVVAAARSRVVVGARHTASHRNHRAPREAHSCVRRAAGRCRADAQRPRRRHGAGGRECAPRAAAQQRRSVEGAFPGHGSLRARSPGPFRSARAYAAFGAHSPAQTTQEQLARSETSRRMLERELVLQRCALLPPELRRYGATLTRATHLCRPRERDQAAHAAHPASAERGEAPWDACRAACCAKSVLA